MWRIGLDACVQQSAEIKLKDATATCGRVTRSTASSPQPPPPDERFGVGERAWLCVWFKSVTGRGGGGWLHLSDNESSSYLSLLLSPLSGGARGPALGYSHYLGDVGLGSGLFSHWQHSLHCHHGKRLRRDALISHSSISSWNHTHTQAQFKQVIFTQEGVLIYLTLDGFHHHLWLILTTEKMFEYN